MPATRRRSAKSVTLTSACASLLKSLEGDLRARVDEDADLAASLHEEWTAAKASGRTGKPESSWTDDLLTQVGASWVLGCVFVRFAEDNDLLDRPLLSGAVEGEEGHPSRLSRAKDEEEAYYAEHPTHAEAEYLENVFRAVAALPGMAGLFDERHAPLWRMRPRSEGARELMAFFRGVDDETGVLRWGFADPERGTRFLGDLYQDLSESARKNFALLQTPDFIEDFILDRTLEPAVETFGLEGLRMIDPTCGSGHFLLGGFARLLEHWRAQEPGTDTRELVRRSLASVHGIDVNPFAVAIARFRLTVAALVACGVERLADAPDFHMPLAVGDSLLHGPRFAGVTGEFSQFTPEFDMGHLYAAENVDELRPIVGQQYHAVVGNPPYITPKDKALRVAYKERFGSCYREYALSVPFLERFAELAVPGGQGAQAGYVGQITSNSFMKREFGKKVIEEFFPRWDLTHVIDTSGTYIPGHGTPTVILLMRNQRPVGESVRAVLGIRGEPETPADPTKGLVWSAIQDQVDRAGSESDYVSVEDVERATFHNHPWSLGGGGAGALFERLEAIAETTLNEVVELPIGRSVRIGNEDVFLMPRGRVLRTTEAASSRRGFLRGNVIRDWTGLTDEGVLCPYQRDVVAFDLSSELWSWRTSLLDRKTFAGSFPEAGQCWFEFQQFTSSAYSTPLSIAFAFVATHNHFVLDRGGKVFKQSAPVIKLPPGSTEEEHFDLLAVLNSSLACFWLRQVTQPKTQTTGMDAEAFRVRREFDGTKLAKFPLREVDGALAAELDSLARRLAEPELLKDEMEALQARMVLLQEELDWLVYAEYGVHAAPEQAVALPEGIALGERAFEIALARRLERGETTTTWFERHGSKPRTTLPEHWPESYRAVVEDRLKTIETQREIRLLEQPEHKRGWTFEAWENRVATRSRNTALDGIEEALRAGLSRPTAVTVNQLSDRLAANELVMGALSALNAEDQDRVLADVVRSEAVPALSVEYLKPSGLRKRAEWEKVWAAQVVEDPFLEEQEQVLVAQFGVTPEEQRRARAHVACWKTSDLVTKEKSLPHDELADITKARQRWLDIDRARQAAIGGETPPVPPKYNDKDFLPGAAWSLRGKLDVPKERFISYPHMAPDGDDSLLVGWAGWDHEQRAAALAQILEARKSEGWSGERLAPILLGIDQLVFWLGKWHGDLAGEYQVYLEGEAAAAGLTLDEVRAWQPPAPTRGRRRKATS